MKPMSLLKEFTVQVTIMIVISLQELNISHCLNMMDEWIQVVVTGSPSLPRLSSPDQALQRR